MDEKQVVGIGYIVTFFNDLESLTKAYAEFVDKYVEMKARQEVDDSEREYMLNLLRQLRTLIIKVYIKALALSDQLELDLNTVKLCYKKLMDNYMVNIELLEDFVIEINKAFANSVIKHVLIQSDVYTKMLEG